jgi:nitrate/TMAO reductase-like tetraheme cytochrome c subunit
MRREVMLLREREMVSMGNSRGWVLLSLVVGLLIGIVLCFAAIMVVHSTSNSNFCLSCHEMNASGRDWQASIHYANRRGVVAQCRDCHIGPGLVQEVKAKFSSGARDMLVHLFQRPRATQEVREDWRKKARASIKDESCRHCHMVLISPGIKKGGIIAHLTYQRSGKRLNLKCITCHYHRFHGPKPEYGTL